MDVKPEETSRLAYPETRESFKEEVAKALTILRELDPANVKCMTVCVIEADPSEEHPTRVKASHIVLGSKAQMSAMMASTYSAIGRTFDSEREAKEVPKEKVQ